MSSPPALLAALAQPRFYRGDEPVIVHETHASWVFVCGTRAFKIKKPVALGFLDYHTLELRHAACLEEVRVNRELAPDIYLGVCAIVPADGGFEFAREHDPEAVEYAVEMRSFRERDSLAGLIASSELTREQLVAVAQRIADFHRAAPSVPGGGLDEVLAMWRTNLRELAGLEPADSTAIIAAEGFGEAFLRAHASELEGRRSSGLVRDGHGDLRCEHVLVRPAVRIVDRVEFDPKLRCTDIACDLAFLTMDLEAQGRRDAAEELLREYRDRGLDPGSDALLSFFAAYRAFVRAKVALIAAGEHEGAKRAALRAEGEAMGALGERLCWRARAPVAIVVCGPAASGKSTLAAEIARRSGFSVISSDAVRKGLAGLKVTEHAGPELYTSAVSQETYERLGSEAERVLGDGTSVIIDATCRRQSDRAPLFAHLQRAGAPVLVVRCEVPLALALERAAHRLRSSMSASDATPTIVAAQHDDFEALTELQPRSLLDLDASEPLAAQVQAITEALDEQLAESIARLAS
jgi:aminoglycoside phosphotransferase family enzyme/predicted kinase